MPFGPFQFFKTRKRRTPNLKSKSNKLSPRTLKRIRTIRTIQQNYRNRATKRKKEKEKQIKIIKTIQDNYTKKLQKSNKFAECPICAGFMINPSLQRRLPCGHVFHTACIARLEPGKRRCPMCRAVFDRQDSLQDLRRKMEEAENPLTRLNDNVISAREAYYEYIENNPNANTGDPELDAINDRISYAEAALAEAEADYLEAREAYYNELYGA